MTPDEQNLFKALNFLYTTFLDDGGAAVYSPSDYFKNWKIPSYKYAAQYLRENGWIDTRKEGRKWLTFWDNQGKRPTQEDAVFLLAEIRKFKKMKQEGSQPREKKAVKEDQISQIEKELLSAIKSLKEENQLLRALLKKYL